MLSSVYLVKLLFSALVRSRLTPPVSTVSSLTLCVLLSSLREVLHDGQGGSRGGPGGHGGGGVLVPSGLHHGLLLLLLLLLLRRDLGLSPVLGLWLGRVLQLYFITFLLKSNTDI